MAFKMNRDKFDFGEGTGSNPLKHDPDGYYASKEAERIEKVRADHEKVKETARKNRVVSEGDGVDEPQSVTQAKRKAKANPTVESNVTSKVEPNVESPNESGSWFSNLGGKIKSGLQRGDEYVRNFWD